MKVQKWNCWNSIQNSGSLRSFCLCDLFSESYRKEGALGNSIECTCNSAFHLNPKCLWFMSPTVRTLETSNTNFRLVSFFFLLNNRLLCARVFFFLKKKNAAVLVSGPILVDTLCNLNSFQKNLNQFSYFRFYFKGESVDLFSWFSLQSKLRSLAVAPTCRKSPSHSFVSVSPTLKLSSRFFRDKTRKSLPPSFKVLWGLPSGRIWTVLTKIIGSRIKRRESRRRRGEAEAAHRGASPHGFSSPYSDSTFF